MADVIKISGSEIAFVNELMTVIDRHAGELTVHQMIGGLCEAGCLVLRGETEEI